MKYVYLFFLLFICSFSIFSQSLTPRINLDLVVKNNIGDLKVLKLGLDSLASDGIDTAFGESDLPPVPPPSAFETRFLLPQDDFAGTLSSYQDYRNAPSFPFTGSKEHRLQYQAGTGNSITIVWNFPPEITGVLQDIIIGTIINYEMAGADSFIVTNPNSINRLKVVINYNNVIPVELTSFTAFLAGSQINLNWNTATEINNSGFEIERKIDNESWNKIGFVTGNGTTTEANSYNYTSKLENYGKVYSFRLRQIDFNGDYSYSNEIKVNVTSPVTFILDQNFPNPFNPTTTISFSIPGKASVKLSIYNQLGQLVTELVNSNLEAGSYNYSWNAGNFSSGIYFYELETNNFKSVKKMTLIK